MRNVPRRKEYTTLRQFFAWVGFFSLIVLALKLAMYMWELATTIEVAVNVSF